MRRAKNQKIRLKGDRLLIRKTIFVNKKRFHKNQANISFEDKIKILVELQKIVKVIKPTNQKVWEI